MTHCTRSDIKVIVSSSPVLSSEKLLPSPELGSLKMLSPFANIKNISPLLKTYAKAHSKLINIAAKKKVTAKANMLRTSKRSTEYVMRLSAEEKKNLMCSKQKLKEELIASYITSTEGIRTISSKSLMVCSCGNECKESICHNCAEKYKFIEHKGYLYGKTESKQLVRYWFVLIGKRLYKYKNRKDTQSTETYNLVNTFLKEEPVEYPNKKFSVYPIKIFLTESQLILYSIKEEEAKVWVNLLRKAMDYQNLTDFYELGKTLGEGKFGFVRTAIHKQTKTKVAIKTISKEKVSIEELCLAKREIEILKVCQHPNIVQILDTFENQDYIYIVMELTEGGDLYGYLEKREFKITEERARSIAHSLATALFYLHSYGIVHRDIKLENILMTDDTDTAEPKLMDFGLSKMIGPNEHCNEAFGTIGYVAPEVIAGQHYDKGVDIWSLGVVLFILLAGCTPFSGETEQEIALYFSLLILVRH
jgi:tRNA A-37 threonylcarbamoyl transferase component Bud32